MRTRSEQTAVIKADQEFWRDLAAAVRPDRYNEPGPMGEWTFGDLAGHLLGWRNRTIARLEAAARGEPDPIADVREDDEAAVDAVNVMIRDNDAGRAPAELVDAYTASYDRVISALDALPESSLTDPQAFPWVGSALIDITFTGHLHEEHVPDVRAWLDKQEG